MITNIKTEPLEPGGLLVRAREEGAPPEFSDRAIPEPIANILRRRGINRLYRHQAEALDRIEAGLNVVITAATGAGKTEVFLIPAVQAALQDGSRSLLMYPTKALARDQLERFLEFTDLGVSCGVYDGDTPTEERTHLRQNLPHLFITNPDMLHYLMLQSFRFRKLWNSLRYIIVDDVHICSGIYGSHVANLLRRLRRLCAIHHAAPQYIAASATIANPAEFCATLFGAPFEWVSSKSPSSPVEHWIVDPPRLPDGSKESYLTRTMKLIRDLLEKRDRLLVFANSHAVVEQLGIMAEDFGITGLEVYRGGLQDRYRREIENAFKSGKLRVLATTSALELGIDIGAVDCVILAGFPGSVTRVRQRIGRAGRRGRRALAVFVARENPLDQYYVTHTNVYLEGTPEGAQVNPDNPQLRRWHLLASLRDFVATREQIVWTFPRCEQEIADLVTEGLLEEGSKGRFKVTNAGLRKLYRLNLRGSMEQVRIYDIEQRKTIGFRDIHMAIGELFPGAIYLLGRRQYEVKFFKMDKGLAGVKSIPRSPLRTSPLTDKEALPEAVEAERKCFGAWLYFGKVRLSTQVHGYLLRHLFSGKTLAETPLKEPLQAEFPTEALWLIVPPSIRHQVHAFADGLHAVEHTAINMTPAVTGTAANEMGGLSYPDGRMFVYDGFPGGAGLARLAYERFEEVLRMTYERISTCPCEDGCPACILDPQCGNANRHLNKRAAVAILGLLVQRGRYVD
jgi:DEAD/DEAH box helicase domain-containing protein